MGADIVIDTVIKELIALWKEQSKDIKRKLIQEAYEETGVPKFLVRIGVNLLDAVIKSNLENNTQKLIQKAEKFPSIQRLLSWILAKLKNKDKVPNDKLNNLNVKDFFEVLQDLERDIIQGVSWNPILTFGTSSTNIEDDIIQQLNAHNQYHTYVGREDSKQILQTFLDQEKVFSWMGIIGGAGSGKTRFAHEFGQIAQQQYWRTGFLEKNSLKHLDQLQNWQPIAPTLIFIDYAKDHVEEVQALLEVLSARDWNDGVIVRLVLIDRYGFKMTVDSQTQTQIDEVRFTQFNGLVESNNLVLSPFADEEIKGLINKFPNINSNQVFNEVKKKGYQSKPLYILLLCIQSKQDRQANVEEILEHLLKRQGKLPWDTADNPYAIKASKAIQIATLFGVFNLQDFACIDVDIEERQKIMQLATNITVGSDKNLKPLEPDLLGEYFVLAFMDFLSENGETLNEVLCNKDLNSYKAYIKRCYDDFPEKLKALYSCLIEPLPDNIKQEIDNYLNPNAEKLYENHLVALLENNIEIARTIFTQLQTLAADDSDNQEIQLTLAKGAVNWLTGLNKNPKDFDEARTVFTQLQTLAADYPNNQEIQLELAKGAVNWFTGLNKNSKDFDEARTVFTQLQTLAAKYPNNQEIQLTLADGAFNWLIGLNKNPEDLDEARTVFTQLQTLFAQYPNDQEIQSTLAKSIFNWLNGLNKNPRYFDEARTVFTQLQTLAADYPHNQEIQSTLAEGAFNWLNGLNKNPKYFDEAKIVFSQLQTLATDHPHNQEIQLTLAEGAFNWLNGLNKNPKYFDEAKTVFSQLQTLATDYPNNQEIQLILAKGTFSWLTSLNKNPKYFNEARTVFSQLQILAVDYPNNQEIQLILAKGAFNWINGLNRNQNATFINEVEPIEQVLLNVLSGLTQQVKSFKPEFVQKLWEVLEFFEQIPSSKKATQVLRQAIQAHFHHE